MAREVWTVQIKQDQNCIISVKCIRCQQIEFYHICCSKSEWCTTLNVKCDRDIRNGRSQQDVNDAFFLHICLFTSFSAASLLSFLFETANRVYTNITKWNEWNEMYWINVRIKFYLLLRASFAPLYVPFLSCSSIHCTYNGEIEREKWRALFAKSGIIVTIINTIYEKMHTHAASPNSSGTIIIIIIKKVFDLSLRFIGQYTIQKFDVV